MRKFVIATNPELAAIDFAEEINSTENPKAKLSMIPKSIVQSEKFWIKLVKIKPEFIARVPEEIIESESFSRAVDHQLFYRYLPKRFLTDEDHYTHKKNPSKAILVDGYPEQIGYHEEYTWYSFKGLPYWYASSQVNYRDVFDHIDELNPVSKICSEFWSQKLADLIWNSPMAIEAFDDIPKEFVRAEWCRLIQIFREKRYPIFGYRDTRDYPELLAEYWQSFKDETQMLMAFKVEKMVERCCNVYRNTRALPQNRKSSNYDFSKDYRKLWEVIRPMVNKNPNLIKKFINLYDVNLSQCIPDELIIEAGNFKTLSDDR